MDLSEKPGMNGVLTIELLDTSGALVEQRRVNNLITTAGKQLLANLLLGKVNALPTRWAIAVGTGVEAANIADTALKTRVDEAVDPSPKVEVITRDGASVVRATVSATLPVPALAANDKPQALSEAGIQITQGNGTAPILFNRVQFAQVNRGANMVMKMTWEITF
ncbi:hypothetical protein JRI60_32295 [Archangium violaceum]|uniref:hypothetical protein n=1 Tax=Archangium violaceum TaxID=83451 RepID=UPI0019506859|nr:hypothetical protein [Archangium violaceum]QRN93827.1 hypothetical protein JRI60_32295 [Archangium violaceum]